MEALNVKLLQNHRNVHIQNDSQIKSCKLIKDGSNTTEVSLKNGNSYRCDLLVRYEFFIYSNAT